jgi:flagellar biosynthetic protein FliP
MTVRALLAAGGLLVVTARLQAASPSLGLGAGTDAAGIPMQILLLLTGLTLLPAALVSLTPFLRIIVVLHFVRQALGTQTAPSNQVLLGLALFLTLLIIGPVVSDVYQDAWKPLETGQLSREQAWTQASKPLRQFWLRFTREKDIKLFLEATRRPQPRNASELDLQVLAPAYILSELKTGFQIGAVLFLPFLVIDIVVASVTLSVGMMQLPPVMVSAPLKILLFVLMDGWNLVVGSLFRSFYA